MSHWYSLNVKLESKIEDSLLVGRVSTALAPNAQGLSIKTLSRSASSFSTMASSSIKFHTPRIRALWPFGLPSLYPSHPPRYVHSATLWLSNTFISNPLNCRTHFLNRPALPLLDCRFAYALEDTRDGRSSVSHCTILPCAYQGPPGVGYFVAATTMLGAVMILRSLCDGEAGNLMFDGRLHL